MTKTLLVQKLAYILALLREEEFPNLFSVYGLQKGINAYCFFKHFLPKKLKMKTILTTFSDKI